MVDIKQFWFFFPSGTTMLLNVCFSNFNSMKILGMKEKCQQLYIGILCLHFSKKIPEDLNG